MEYTEDYAIAESLGRHVIAIEPCDEDCMSIEPWVEGFSTYRKHVARVANMITSNEE